ncbi:MAG: BREX system ATP-binding domain-containing protein, partial [Clostridium perfringens]
SNISDDEIKRFIMKEYIRPGADERLTSRDIISAFLGALNILYQNPEYDKNNIFCSEQLEENIGQAGKDLINNRFKKSYQ